MDQLESMSDIKLLWNKKDGLASNFLHFLTDHQLEPGPVPEEPYVSDYEENYATLSWPKPTHTGGAPIIAYRIEKQTVGSDDDKWHEVGVSPSNTFDVYHLKSDEQYHFRVTARNRYGWGQPVSTSTPVIVNRRITFPEFECQLPGNLKVLLHSTAKLQCQIKDFSPDVSIIWSKDGGQVCDDSEHIRIEQKEGFCSLAIEDISYEDGGRYICQAQNIKGKVSTYATLMVVDDPVIIDAEKRLNKYKNENLEAGLSPQFTMRLRDRRVQMTYPVRLTCQVSGYPKPRVKWYHNDELISPNDHYSTYDESDDFHSLEISKSILEDSGEYVAMASNSNGSVSCRCCLTVDKGIRAYLPPHFVHPLQPEYVVEEGEQIRISAVVRSYPSVGICWYRNGVRLRPSRHISMTLDHDGVIEFAIANANRIHDGGQYTCSATNEVASAQTATRIQVVESKDLCRKPSLLDNIPLPLISTQLYSKEPYFVTKPRSCKANEGDKVIIKCEVIGDPEPQVIWLRDRLKLEYYRDASDFRVISEPLIGRHRLEIARAELDHTGAYTVTALNQHGQAKAIVSLQVYATSIEDEDKATVKYSPVEMLPVVKKELSHIKCCDGDSVIFECIIDSDPNCDVKWKKNNKLVRLGGCFETEELEGGVQRLIIQNVYPEDEATYTCHVSNNIGSTSTSACLVVNVPEEKETLLRRQLRRPMDSDTLSVRSTPASTPTSTPSRSVSPILSRHLAEERRSSRKRPAAPKFYAILHNKIVQEGEPVRFQCAVSGHPVPWSSWDKDGEPLEQNARISIREDSDLRTVIISAVTGEDAGLYRIRVENEFGMVESTARLDVIGKKSKRGLLNAVSAGNANGCTSQGTGRIASVGSSCTITCDIPHLQDGDAHEDGSRQCSAWYKNGVPLATSDRIFNENCNQLELRELRSGDSGVYTCVAANSDSRCSAELVVVDQHIHTQMHLKPPVFVKGLPSVVRCKEGDCVKLLVNIQGTLPMDVTWLHNDLEIPDSDDSSYEQINEQTFSLTLTDVLQNDGGCYSCIVFNCDGNAITKTNIFVGDFLAPNGIVDNQLLQTKSQINGKNDISLLGTNEQEQKTSDGVKRVAIAARILQGPHDATVLQGTTARLQATIVGDPEPEIHWLKAGRKLLPSKRVRMMQHNGRCSLRVDKITADDGGKYSLNIENAYGKDCHFASLAVEGCPEAPSGRPSVTVAETSVTVTWCSPPYDGGCRVTGYTVEMSSIDDNDRHWTPVVEKCHSLSYVVHGLHRGESYIFRVRAENIRGLSEPSAESISAYINHADMSPTVESKQVEIANGDMFAEQYDIFEEMGRGRYGVVHRVKERRTNVLYAAKFIKCIKAKDKDSVREEIAIMNKLRHPKLLRLQAAYEKPRELIMVTECVSGGELFERVVADDFTLTERDCILFMRQICEGVAYMHKKNIVHLDLKPENIMCVSRTSHDIKLIDFGLATCLQADHPVRVLMGTAEFISPEVINYDAVGTQSDMWSIGVICYVILSGISPFMGDNDAETFANVTRGIFDFDDEQFDSISQTAKDFITSLLVTRKEKRMSAEECLHHEWLSQHVKTMNCVKLCTDKLKKFIIRRKWQKTGTAIRAVGRMAHLTAAHRIAHTPRLSLSESALLAQANNMESIDENLSSTDSSPTTISPKLSASSFNDDLATIKNDDKGDLLTEEDTIKSLLPAEHVVERNVVISPDCQNGYKKNEDEESFSSDENFENDNGKECYSDSSISSGDKNLLDNNHTVSSDDETTSLDEKIVSNEDKATFDSDKTILNEDKTTFDDDFYDEEKYKTSGPKLDQYEVNGNRVTHRGPTSRSDSGFSDCSYVSPLQSIIYESQAYVQEYDCKDESQSRAEKCEKSQYVGDTQIHGNNNELNNSSDKCECDNGGKINGLAANESVCNGSNEMVKSQAEEVVSLNGVEERACGSEIESQMPLEESSGDDNRELQAIVGFVRNDERKSLSFAKDVGFDNQNESQSSHASGFARYTKIASHVRINEPSHKKEIDSLFSAKDTQISSQASVDFARDNKNEAQSHVKDHSPSIGSLTQSSVIQFTGNKSQSRLTEFTNNNENASRARISDFPRNNQNELKWLTKEFASNNKTASLARVDIARNKGNASKSSVEIADNNGIASPASVIAKARNEISVKPKAAPFELDINNKFKSSINGTTVCSAAQACSKTKERMKIFENMSTAPPVSPALARKPIVVGSSNLNKEKFKEVVAFWNR